MEELLNSKQEEMLNSNQVEQVHSKLRGRIVEILGSKGGKSILSEKLGITSASLENKLKGVTDFKSSEMFKICDILSIDKSDMYEYFDKGRKGGGR